MAVTFTSSDNRRARLLYAFGAATFLVLLGRMALLDFAPRSEFFHGHGYCYLWQPDLVAAHVISDMLIGLSYVAISATLAVLVYRARTHLPFNWIFLAFGAFIVACGATHLMEVWTLWTPVFWLSADVKIITAVASVATAIVLPPLLPKVMRLLDEARLSGERQQALEHAHAELEERVQQRTAELRDALARAEEANRLKEVFLGTVSHELRTPLNAILGWSRMLAKQNVDPAFLRRGLAVIDRNAAIQAELVEDLLDMSRITAGTLKLELEPVDLVQAVDEALDAVRPMAEARQIALHVHPAVSSLAMRGDARRLRQVAWNLLTNAVKFTPAGGRVDVDVEIGNAGQAILRVRDTGIGLTPEFLPRLFDRFAQADTGMAREHEGLGLGLAITRHLVEMHGGRIAGESEGPGRGTTFTVTLPLLPKRAVAEPARKPQPFIERLDGVRILVVDDHEDTRMTLSMMLTAAGASVDTAASADEALDRIGGTMPDILVSDLAMPQRDGYDLIRTIRGAEDPSVRELPAVAVSAYARHEDRRRALEAGFSAHVAKPVQAEELVHVIGSVLE